MPSLKHVFLALFAFFSASSLETDSTKIVENAKQQFEDTDVDQNHIISLKEMVNSYDELLNAGFDKSKIQSLTQQTFDEFDLNSNGFEWEEYLNMTLTKVQKQRKQAERRRLDPPELDSV